MPLFHNQNANCALIGMIHLKPLPGTPNSTASMHEILNAADKDAQTLVDGGCDALLVENMADLPYLCGKVGPEITAAMAIALDRIVHKYKKPTGVQILAGANLEAMAVATCAGADFIRAEAFAYAHVADEGLMNASAAQVLRLRKHIDSNVKVWADVQKKHSAHAITSDVPLKDLAHGFAFCGADALIITGVATGSAAKPTDVLEVKPANLPIIVGSGVSLNNIRDFASICDGIIVGTAIKKDAIWQNPVELQRVRDLRKALDANY